MSNYTDHTDHPDREPEDVNEETVQAPQPDEPEEESMQPENSAPARPPRRSAAKAVTIILLALIAIAALAITLFGKRDGPLPTWQELYELAGFTEAPETHADQLAVHFIDVGQGDGILIQTPTGETVVIDAGERGNEKKMISYIKQYGDDTLEYVVATHPHSDHIGSLDNVIAAFTVRNVVMPRLTQINTPTHSFYKDLLTAVKKSGAKMISAKPCYTIPLGRGQCTVLSPSVQSEKLNDMSVVLRLDWGETSFLFMGDAGVAVEKQLLNGKYAGYLDADVLKVGHHGSGTSSSAMFLKAVDPRFGVISCGAGNDYGHPHKGTMDKLTKLGTTVLRTDTMGSIRIYSDGRQMYTETDNG
ncbi:MAG: MBL fold metallo-hydrolase [Clostridia bacterium]|nr:MBL fold metallo-hydrolase [Clostridia bacterium]